MGSLDIIRQQTAAVLSGGPQGLTDLWTGQNLLSQPGVVPRVYGTWQGGVGGSPVPGTTFEIWGLRTALSQAETYDQDRQTYSIMSTCKFRIAAAWWQSLVFIGDQLIEPASPESPAGLAAYWNVLGELSSGPGTVLLQLGRQLGTIAGSDRKGPL
jgi:hypothetical protein